MTEKINNVIFVIGNFNMSSSDEAYTIVVINNKIYQLYITYIYIYYHECCDSCTLHTNNMHSFQLHREHEQRKTKHNKRHFIY